MKAIFLASIGSIAVQPILFFFILAISTFPNIEPTPWKGASNEWILILVAAFIHLLFLGLPTFLLLKRYKKLSFISMALSGFTIALMPIVMVNTYSVISSCGGLIEGSSALFNGQILCQNGFPTSLGWLYVAFRSWVLDLHGGVGSLVFYILWVKIA